MPDTLISATAIVKVSGTQKFQNASPTEIRIRKAFNAPAHLHLRFDLEHADAGSFTIGAEVTVDIDDTLGETQSNVFKGDVVAVGLDIRLGRSEVVVDAYDKSHAFFHQTVVADFTDSTVSDIVSDVIGGTGLDSQVDSTSYTLATYHQRGTLAETLAELCAWEGADWYVSDGKFYFQLRANDPPSSEVTLTHGETLRAFNVRLSSIEQVSTIDVRGWDPASKEAVVASVEVGDLQPGNATAVADKTEGGHTAVVMSPYTYTQSTAESHGKSIGRAMNAAAVAGSGECDVQPAIEAGKTVTIDGTGTDWDGDYVVSSVEHRWGRSQPFVTRFTIGGTDAADLPGLLAAGGVTSAARLAHGLTIGIVTNNSDDGSGGAPGMHAVKVKFPYMSDEIESAWARVVSVGAGADRGLMVLPEVDDEVLVGFEHGDISRPYVLGGLWNGTDSPPSDAAKTLKDGAVVLRQFKSRTGHVLGFSDADDESFIEVQHADESMLLVMHGKDGISLASGGLPILIGNDKASIEIDKDGNVTIKADGKLDIRAQGDVSIDTKGNLKGTATSNVEFEATSNFNAKGTAGANLEASGNTAVKGAMVNIN